MKLLNSHTEQPRATQQRIFHCPVNELKVPLFRYYIMSRLSWLFFLLFLLSSPDYCNTRENCSISTLITSRAIHNSQKKIAEPFVSGRRAQLKKVRENSLSYFHIEFIVWIN